MIRRDLADIPSYVPGKSDPDALKLSSNEGAFGPPPGARAAMAEAAADHARVLELNRELREIVAPALQVPVDQLVTVPREATPDDIERLVARYGYSRYPTTDEAGELMGYLHLKDVLYADETERGAQTARSLAGLGERLGALVRQFRI